MHEYPEEYYCIIPFLIVISYPVYESLSRKNTCKVLLHDYTIPTPVKNYHIYISMLIVRTKILNFFSLFDTLENITILNLYQHWKASVTSQIPQGIVKKKPNGSILVRVE